MFKKSLLIIGLGLSLNTQTNPLTWKNTVRSTAVLGAVTTMYGALAISMNKYLTLQGFQDLNFTESQRFGSTLFVLAGAVAVAALFRHAETIK